MNSKKIRMGFIISIALLLTACGASIDCNQKDMETSISNMAHNGMLTISDTVGPYWTYSLKDKLTFAVSDIKETSQSDNGKSKTCEAIVTTTLPPLSEQPPEEFRFLLMSIKDQVLGAGNALNVLAGNEENPNQISTSIAYIVSKVEKSSSGDPISVEFQPEDVHKIIDPIIYRMYQTIFLDLAKFKPNSYTPNNQDKDRLKPFVERLAKDLQENKEIPENEKTIRLCTIKKIINTSTLDAYLGLEVIFDVFHTKNPAASVFGSIFSDGLLKDWMTAINEARVSCGGTVPTE